MKNCADFTPIVLAERLARQLTNKNFPTKIGEFLLTRELLFSAFFKLECLKIKRHRNHFALRAHLYLKAIRVAFDELQVLKAV
jgi:hypothetical protein